MVSTTYLFAQTGINSYYYTIQKNLALNSYTESEEPIQLKDSSSLFISQESMFSILPVSFFSSYNSSYQNGGYDGGLWQGKGLNTQLIGGFYHKSRFLEIVFAPEVNFSQNAQFSLIDSVYKKANKYGNVFNQIDLPQRFGDEHLLNWNLGESLIRANYKNLYVGFGTENSWVGFSNFSPFLYSNNASGYPKFELGLKSTTTQIGDFEFRTWGGVLSESNYFDDDSDNDNWLQTALAFGYRPSFIRGFSIGVNRFINTPMDGDSDWYWELFDYSFNTGRYKNDDPSGDFDVKDQRVSITSEWKFPSVGLRIYGEAARNDSFSNLRRLFQTPWQSMVFDGGFEKSFLLESGAYFNINLEIANTWESRDYHLSGSYRPGLFYSHNVIRQGYTNEGQILGSYIGSGSDYQTIRFIYGYQDLYSMGLRFHRMTRNDDYIYSAVYYEDADYDKSNINVEILSAVFGHYKFDSFWLSGELGYAVDYAHNYDSDLNVNNVFASFELKYMF